MSNVLRFRKAPHVELDGGIIISDADPSKVGQHWYFLDYVDEEGGHLGVWDGPSYGEAREALALWRQDGVRAVDLIGETLS